MALWRLTERLGQGLGVPAVSPVVPLVVGSEAAAIGLSARLLREYGMHVPAIRPPTVPQVCVAKMRGATYVCHERRPTLPAVDSTNFSCGIVQ